MSFTQIPPSINPQHSVVQRARDKPIELKLSSKPAKIIDLAFRGNVGNFERWLFEHPDDRTLKDEKLNVEPIHISSFKGHLAVVEFLIYKRIDLNPVDIFGNTPLYYAIDQQHLEVVIALVKGGIHVNHANYRGTTPLHLAASVNSAPIVKLLLRHGADPDPLDHYNRRPTDQTSSDIISEVIERAVEYKKAGISAPPNETVNWMGFGVGLGMGMAFCMVQQHLKKVEEERVAEQKRIEDERMRLKAQRVMEADAKQKQFQRRFFG